ncbi:MAG: hypothetical protein JWO82_3061 [Akkermansiaceae bacterium]|nr:hypothetical protein [Akkermansiaceae bacterium]
MKRLTLLSLVSLALCGVAVWTGGRLARASSRPVGNPATMHTVAPARPGEAAAAGAAQDDVYSLEQRRALAACDSSALWDWLKTSAHYSTVATDDVIRELLDRFGAEALSTALAIPEPEIRGLVTSKILRELAERDPAVALEILRLRRAELSLGAAYLVGNQLLETAGGKSADELIATYDVVHGQNLPPSPDRLDCPPGFDFRKALDHMAAAEGALPLMAPQLFREWGNAAPAAAAKWLADHAPERPWSVGTMDDPGDPVSGLISTIATSDRPERQEAYATLMQLPEEIRGEAWKSLNDSAGRRPLDSGMLEAATAMGERDGYLKNALLGTRFRDEPDPAWAQVPPEERAGLLAWEAAQWERETQEKAAPPVAEKIRAHWRARLEEQWRQLKK